MAESEGNGLKTKLITTIAYGWVLWVSGSLIALLIFMGRGDRFTQHDGFEIRERLIRCEIELNILKSNLIRHEDNQFNKGAFDNR